MRRRLMAATLAVVAVSVFSLGLPLLVVTVRLVADSARTELLRVLLEEAGAVVTRNRIMREVWDDAEGGASKTLDMHVSWLRRKLGDDPQRSRLLTTVRGVGFRFERG